MNVATSTSFINFGAFLAFIMVNVSVIVYWARERRNGNRLGVVLYLICPIIGVLVIGFLLTQLDIHAVVLGSTWLVIGAVILAFTTKGFRRQPSELAVDSVEAD